MPFHNEIKCVLLHQPLLLLLLVSSACYSGYDSSGTELSRAAVQHKFTRGCRAMSTTTTTVTPVREDGTHYAHAQTQQSITNHAKPCCTPTPNVTPGPGRIHKTQHSFRRYPALRLASNASPRTRPPYGGATIKNCVSQASKNNNVRVRVHGVWTTHETRRTLLRWSE